MTALVLHTSTTKHDVTCT